MMEMASLDLEPTLRFIMRLPHGVVDINDQKNEVILSFGKEASGNCGRQMQDYKRRQI
jgi:hypothetical protein